MARTERQKELRSAYQTRTVVGGVCLIENTITKRCYLVPAANPQAQRNRLEFAQKTGGCLLPAMGADWKDYGGATFAFRCLETLEKRAEQTDKEFAEELNLLAEIWRERLESEGVIFYA